MTDSQFTKLFAAMIGALAILAVVLYLLANSIGGRVTAQIEAAEANQSVAERIRPVGSLKVAANAMMETVIPAANADAHGKGKGTYDAACGACHGTGVAGAPKLGDKAAWTDRIAQGNDKMYSNAINGFQGKAGYMPAKGGNASLSDDDVKAAVDYMVGESK